MTTSPRLRVEQVDDTRVVRFVDRHLLDDRTIREVSEPLMHLAASGPSPRLVLDFSGVETISSAMLGKLILLHRRIDPAGGMLRLCGTSEAIRAVLRTTNLDRLFRIDRDAREAVENIA